MKLCCVPQEPTEKIICAFADNVLQRRNQVTREEIIAGWKAALCARPPLPADIEAAVELAKGIAAHYAHLRAEYPGTWGKDTTSEERIARALLKCNGKDAVVAHVKATLDRLRTCLSEAEGLLRLACERGVSFGEPALALRAEIERFLNDH